MHHIKNCSSFKLLTYEAVKVVNWYTVKEKPTGIITCYFLFDCQFLSEQTMNWQAHTEKPTGIISRKLLFDFKFLFSHYPTEIQGKDKICTDKKRFK